MKYNTGSSGARFFAASYFPLDLIVRYRVENIPGRWRMEGLRVASAVARKRPPCALPVWGSSKRDLQFIHRLCVLLHQSERLEYTSFRMTLRTRLWAVTALLALLGTPGLSCLVPRQLLSASESDCCRQMGSQCGSQEMSSPQSCCKSPSQNAQPYVSSGAHLRLASAVAVTAVLPVAQTPVPHVVNEASATGRSHSPPISLPESNSVLRI